MTPAGSPQWADPLGSYLVLALLGLLAAGLVAWAIVGEVRERRSARAAARFARFRDVERKPPRCQP
jgi:hypothetical protein